MPAGLWLGGAARTGWCAANPEQTLMKVHVLGAGNVGGSIIRAAARAGHTVTVWVRDPAKIQDLLDETGAAVADRAGDADVVVSSLPHAVAAQVLPSWDLAGTVLIDACNPLSWAGGPVHAPPDGHGSAAAHLQALLPDTRVVKAFNTFGAEHSIQAAAGERPLDHFIAGDDADAKDQVSAFLESLNLRPLDLGPLRNAATLEHLAVTWIHLAMVSGRGRSIQLALLGG